ncbi:MAG: hypothetical protein HQL46_16845 [Gammaproteobacteria bacterium]|nr:hypothetical protein [Gammaproteobacteria bacterium]
MNINIPIPQEKKLNVIVRLEPSCLGPDGINQVEKFCNIAQKEINTIDSDFINWNIIPRYDKSLPEIQYKAINKIITHNQAEKYLKIFDKSLDEFEKHFNNKLTVIINQYLGY